MSENSKIEWTDHTFNPWEGCQKVSPGCDHCYAETRNARFGGGTAINWGPGAPRRRTSTSNWTKPIAWNKAHAEFFAAHGRRQRVFCASLADVFDNAVDPGWRAELFALITATQNLDWLLLTKRIGNADRMLGEDAPWPNIWLGATVVNQEEADRDIPKLRAVLVAKRFLSIEPLLGPISLASVSRGGTGREGNIHWLIVGGESGPGARPMHPDWARNLRDECAAAEVPFLFKQWGEWSPRGPASMGYPLIENVPRIRITDAGENGQQLGAAGGNDVWMQRAGKKVSGRLLDGVQHDGYPEAP